jgi:hypothetical protein
MKASTNAHRWEENDKKPAKTGKPKGNFIGTSGLYWEKGKDGNLIWRCQITIFS